jgi:hypothetical protein
MPKFKLKETTVTVRDEAFVVRELTHAERSQWVKAAQVDQYRGPSLLISLGAVNPRVTEDEADAYPSDVVSELALTIMKLSGLAREGAEKKSDAG